MIESLEFVTDSEMIALCEASEQKRKAWFEENSKTFVPDPVGSASPSGPFWTTVRATWYVRGYQRMDG